MTISNQLYFFQKMKGKLNYRHMSAFLVSSENVLKVRNTVVMDEVDKLSKSIMSTRHNFELRKLAPKRKLKSLKWDFRKSVIKVSDFKKRNSETATCLSTKLWTLFVEFSQFSVSDNILEAQIATVCWCGLWTLWNKKSFSMCPILYLKKV